MYRTWWDTLEALACCTATTMYSALCLQKNKKLLGQYLSTGILPVSAGSTLVLAVHLSRLREALGFRENEKMRTSHQNASHLNENPSKRAHEQRDN